MDSEPGRPFPLGATVRDGGTNFAVVSEVADAVELCLFGDDGAEERVELSTRTGYVWHRTVQGVGAGQRYGLRVHGPWKPSEGLRCNPAKLLLDPYATALEGAVTWGEAVFGHRFDDPEERNDDDSAPSMPRCVTTASSFDWGDDTPPGTPLDESIIYETHVKGLTRRHPDVPEDQRGTYAGLAHPSVLGYLVDLGVTAVELLPVHSFVHDAHLLERGLRNYWGYNSIGFLSPHAEYSASGAGGGQVDEFKSMVKALHAAGLEVILDVVYNHTAEGNHLGPTLSLKGIDNPAYYRLVADDRAHYFDTTGTGNSLNVGHPAALRLIMDSLRYWVTEMHVDGFRFDLAAALTRQTGELDIHSAFLNLVEQDPTLAGVKVIAEPWDLPGNQLGGFPARWSEWNGRYRDSVRDFWRGEGSIGDFALRLTGSGDLYAPSRRPPTASINYVTSHDGFTLADLTSYDGKHNEANGEDNNDGEDASSSWNCGAEGPTDDPEVLALRARQRRNFLGTLLLSAGVPMLLGGDELGRTQGGNNNAYCQDNETSWYDWEHVDEELADFVRTAIALRREYPALRPREYLRGPGGGPAQLVLYATDGTPMTEEDWTNPDAVHALGIGLDGRQIPDVDGDTSHDRFLLLVNAHHEPIRFTTPHASVAWRAVLTTRALASPPTATKRGVELEPRSLALFRASHEDAAPAGH